VTVKNLEIIEIDKENGLVYLKGAVPGTRHSMVMMTAPGELKLETAPPADEKTPEKVEDKKPEEQK
jgi:hypothetical protein